MLVINPVHSFKYTFLFSLSSSHFSIYRLQDMNDYIYIYIMLAQRNRKFVTIFTRRETRCFMATQVTTFLKSSLTLGKIKLKLFIESNLNIRNISSLAKAKSNLRLIIKWYLSNYIKYGPRGPFYKHNVRTILP